MNSRMDKYKDVHENMPKRSDKNKELYKQIYNGYDEFENLIVPSNTREINSIDELSQNVTTRSNYQKNKEYLIDYKKNKEEKINSSNSFKEKREVYDIKELLNKAVTDNKSDNNVDNNLSSGDYLKKLKLDDRRSNLEQVKEQFRELAKENLEEDESLIRTANLSLDILSDLKSDNDNTMVNAPILEGDLFDDDMNENDDNNNFYGDKYKFCKKDFDSKPDDDMEIDEDFIYEESSGFKYFLKVLLLIFGLCLVVFVLLYLVNYFGRA